MQSHLHSTATALFAGAATSDITPPDQVFLYGYPHVPRLSTGVHDRLESAALYLRQEGQAVLFIANDLIFVGRQLSRDVRRRISIKSGLPAEAIAITATHTHSGPVTVDGLSHHADPVVPKADPSYLQWVADSMVEAGCAAIRSAQPAEVGLFEDLPQRGAAEVQAAQAKHKGDAEKTQKAVMQVYADAGISPFAPLAGCLPMLLPMPILFALFFVFQNTIEFRGVPFLWFPDISVADPYYIAPLLTGGSMFLLSWLGMRNVPPNPQAKMMAWMMPVMMTVFGINFAAGLNLYWFVQNFAAMPQQWLIANERGKVAAVAPVVAGGGERKRR